VAAAVPSFVGGVLAASPVLPVVVVGLNLAGRARFITQWPMQSRSSQLSRPAPN